MDKEKHVMFPALSERERAECPEPCQTPQPESPSGELKRLQKWGAEWFKEELRDASLFRPCTSQKDVSVK